MSKKNLKPVVIWIIIVVLFSIVNLFFAFITVPESGEIVQREIDYITISTVFIGFAFTSLGILLGMSSEKLIRRIKNTSIILKKVLRIIRSVIFLFLSMIVSFYFVFEINNFLFNKQMGLNSIDKAIYVCGVGFLSVGIVYYAISIYELYDLIKRTYIYGVDKGIRETTDKAVVEMEQAKIKLKNAKDREKSTDAEE